MASHSGSSSGSPSAPATPSGGAASSPVSKRKRAGVAQHHGQRRSKRKRRGCVALTLRPRVRRAREKAPAVCSDSPSASEGGTPRAQPPSLRALRNGRRLAHPRVTALAQRYGHCLGGGHAHTRARRQLIARARQQTPLALHAAHTLPR